MAKEQSSRATGFLTGVATFLLMVGTLVVLLAVASAIFGWGSAVTVHTHIDGSHLDRIPEGVFSPNQVSVTATLRDADRGQQWLAALSDASLMLFAMIVLFLGRRILQSAHDGDPFTKRNVGLLRTIAFLFLVGLPLVSLVGAWSNSQLASALPGNWARSSVGVAATGPYVSVCVFALAEIFARGVRLREDVEATV